MRGRSDFKDCMTLQNVLLIGQFMEESWAEKQAPLREARTVFHIAEKLHAELANPCVLQ